MMNSLKIQKPPQKKQTNECTRVPDLPMLHEHDGQVSGIRDTRYEGYRYDACDVLPTYHTNCRNGESRQQHPEFVD